MKAKKRRFRHIKGEKASLRSMLKQPPDNFYHLPDFEMRGGYLMTEGCRKVLDFEPQKICLDMGDFLVTFYGTNLQIESLTGKRVVLTGRIHQIRFRSKWEAVNHET